MNIININYQLVCISNVGNLCGMYEEPEPEPE